MHTPIEVERRFQLLLETLAEPSATSYRLIRAAEFIDAFGGQRQSWDAYVVELAEGLPSPDQAPGFYGVDPRSLHRTVETVEGLVTQVPALGQHLGLREKLESFRQNLAVAYAHVGGLAEACAVLGADRVPEWLKLFGTAPAGSARDMLTLAAEEARMRQQSIAAQLSALQQIYPLPIGGRAVYLPVLEKTPDQGVLAHGVLRKAHLGALRRSTSGLDELGTNILMYGPSQSHEDLLARPLKAARSVAREHALAVDDCPVAGELLFDRADALHRGSSSDLAFASLFLCALAALFGGRERMEMSRDVALTGIVTEEGDVTPVDAAALEAKVAAAFHSPVQCLVVPRVQQVQTERIRAVLQTRYPARVLEVVGVAHVRELLYDRRVTDRQRVSLPSHIGETLWKLRRPIAGVLLLLLSAVTFRLWYGPLDKNAVHMEAVGNVLRLYNATGSLVRTIDVGGETSLTLRTEISWGLPYVFEIATLADLDGDGINELVWATMHGTDTPVSQIRCTDLRTGEDRWRTPLLQNVHFPNSPDVVGNRFQPSKVAVADVDADGVPEVYALLNHLFFPAFLVRLDASSGTLRGRYLHTGHLRDVAFADLDHDGRQEILLTGTNNAYKEAVLAVLDAGAMEGCSPSTPQYTPAGYREAMHRAYLRFPRTVVGEALLLKSDSAVGVDIAVDPSTAVLIVTIVDVSVASEDPGERSSGAIYAQLDFAFHFKKYGSGSSYDRIYELLAGAGKIPSVDRGAYLQHVLPGPLRRSPSGWSR